jgi:hypothetical protein
VIADIDSFVVHFLDQVNPFKADSKSGGKLFQRKDSKWRGRGEELNRGSGRCLL